MRFQQEERLQAAKPLHSIFERFAKGDAVSVSDALDELDKYVSEVLRFVPSSKMRNIYALIKRASLQTNDEVKLKEIVYFKYKIAYMAARDSNLKRFERDMVELIKSVVQDKALLDNFFTFAEAIVAFHKKYAK